MAEPFTITFNTEAILNATEKPWVETNELFGRKAQQGITSNIWGWLTDPSPRDIVDKGQLRDSYTPTRITPTVYEHAWNTEYAMAVLLGAVRSNGATMPARNWIKWALNEFDFADTYARLARAELAKIRTPQ